jgi:hypothetical protein
VIHLILYFPVIFSYIQSNLFQIIQCLQVSKEFHQFFIINTAIFPSTWLFALLQIMCHNYTELIKALKAFTNLNAKYELFWRDTFSSKEIPLDNRLETHQIFNTTRFSNLYEWLLFKTRLSLLHSFVLTVLDNADILNIYVRQNYSQSSLAYHFLL